MKVKVKFGKAKVRPVLVQLTKTPNRWEIYIPSGYKWTHLRLNQDTFLFDLEEDDERT